MARTKRRHICVAIPPPAATVAQLPTEEEIAEQKQRKRVEYEYMLKPMVKEQLGGYLAIIPEEDKKQSVEENAMKYAMNIVDTIQSGDVKEIATCVARLVHRDISMVSIQGASESIDNLMKLYSTWVSLSIGPATSELDDVLTTVETDMTEQRQLLEDQLRFCQ